jgi:hypothetical protein
MKNLILYILFVCLFTSVSVATHYEFTTDTYTPGLTLHTGDSLYMTNGGFGDLNLFGNSTATIKETSPLSEGIGGIWNIELSYSSSINLSGGQVHMIDIGNGATAYISGGFIQQIWSGQIAWQQSGNPPVPVWNPHITIECLDHFYNTNTKLLTGHWFDDGTAFSIQLIDVQGYSPAIQNIQFVPEPATMLLLGLGGLFLRQRRK